MKWTNSLYDQAAQIRRKRPKKLTNAKTQLTNAGLAILNG